MSSFNYKHMDASKRDYELEPAVTQMGVMKAIHERDLLFNLKTDLHTHRICVKIRLAVRLIFMNQGFVNNKSCDLISSM